MRKKFGHEHRQAARAVRKLAELTPHELADHQRRWEAARPALARFLPFALRGAKQAADREDREAVFWARTWQSWRHMARRGARPEDGLSSISWFAALSSLSRRCFTGGSPATDPLNARSGLKGAPARHCLEALPRSARDELQRPNAVPSLERLLTTVCVDRRASNPADRAAVREAIRVLLERHPGTFRTVVLHLMSGSTPGEAARAADVSASRVSHIRRAAAEAYSSLGD